jgi:iron complex outermembrane recepter protein
LRSTDWLLGLALALAAGPSCADDADGSPAPSEVTAVTVIAATPLPGAQIDVAKAPFDVRTLSSADVDRDGWPSATGALVERIGGVSINDNLDDSFQPDVLYRGFEASPVLGVPEGLAVYQNGVRINEAFGDVVNWDLIADPAIARIDVIGSNPVYGLNALGGAVVVTMQDGFSDPGGAAAVTGGSFGRRSADLSYGAHSDRFALFVAARALDADGWRDLSSDSVRQLYADVAARTDRLNLDLSFEGADNLLHGESAAPVQELAVSRKLIFTSPQANADELAFGVLKGSYRATAAISLQGDLYYRGFRQSVANGNTTDDVACVAPGPAGQLCQSDGTTALMTTTGGPVPDISNGGAIPIGENDREALDTQGYGGSVQATSTARVLGLGNQIAVGGSIDGADVDFGSSAELGVIDSTLVVQPSGLFVGTPEGTPFTATPVALTAHNTYAGAYFTDTLDLTNRLTLTASGRYNTVRIALVDLRGDSLNGVSRYARFDPAIGFAYRFTPEFTAYLGYAEGSRAPTASEIECSDPTRPCLLPSSLSADPPTLKQVVSRTVEAGARGGVALGSGRLGYSVGLYRTDVRDDIYGVATSLSAGFFQNIPGTRRAGAEFDLNYRDDRLSAFLSYALVDATFQSDFELPSASNPFSDASGNIHVRPGDHLPGIPQNRLKLGLEYRLTPAFSLGAEAQIVDDQVYHGDESNQLQPLPGYAVLNVHGSYALTHRLELFGRIDNALDASYATFGILGDPTGAGAPGVPESGIGVDPRFQSPAAPFAAFAGLRLSY